MQKEQRTFSEECKVEAVRLATTSGKPITEIARVLGINDSTIHNWCKQFAQHGEQAFPGSSHQTTQEEEPHRLKCELEVVKQERDIGKKASLSSRGTSHEVSLYRRTGAAVSIEASLPRAWSQ